jgi:purine-binding chemotaxis protein CheW
MKEQNNNVNSKNTKVDDQKQILNQYLDSLLSEVVEYSEPEKQTETELKQQTAEVIALTPAPEVVPEEAQQQDVQDQVSISEQSIDEHEEQDERPAPEWAQEPFQCLIFRVGGITLATPLLALDNIVKWEKELTPMPFQPDWHLGVLQNRDDKVVVVDTTKLLMLDQPQEEVIDNKEGSHILIIGEHHFGLACESLAKPLFLKKEDIRWAIRHEDRPWMAGTIKDKLTILLDIDELLEIIRHE